MNKTNTDGVSLRDYFAGKAMAAIMLADGIAYVNNTVEHAKLAYEQADAMLAERERAALAQGGGE